MTKCSVLPGALYAHEQNYIKDTTKLKAAASQCILYSLKMFSYTHSYVRTCVYMYLYRQEEKENGKNH